MTIESSRQDKTAIIRLTGRMDAENSSQFEEACKAALRDGAINLVVGVAGLEYVSSMGLRSFLTGAKGVQGKGGVMALCGMKGLVKEVFDMTHLTPLFKLFDTPETALESL